MRHTMRLAEAGATPDVARIILGHSLTRRVSERCITSHLMLEAVRPVVSRVAECSAELMGWAASPWYRDALRHHSLEMPAT
jgi:hypothetical protein